MMSAKELESLSEDAQPLSGAVVSAERKQSSSTPEGTDPRVAWQDHSTEKQTKGTNIFSRGLKAVKRHIQTHKTKVCPLVPDLESETTDKKHTKGTNIIGRGLKAVKRRIQTHKTKVCALVPEQESQELPHTSSVEPPAGTDAGTEPTAGLVVPVETTDSPSEIEQTPDTNPVDHEMMMCLPGQVCEDLCVAGPSKMKKTQHADPVDPELPPVPDPSSCDLDDKKQAKGTNIFSRGLKAVKHHIQTLKTKVCALVPELESQELPHTSSVEPPDGTDALDSKPTDGTDAVESEPTDGTDAVESKLTAGIDVLVETTDRSFKSLYYSTHVKLSSSRDCFVYEGFRKLDNKRVAIKFVSKLQPEKLLEWPGYSIPLSRDAASMLLLQEPPFNEHIITFYDMFVREDKDILILEYPCEYVTFFEYAKQNRGRLTEDIVKCILEQLIVALQHCRDRGIYHNTDMKNILINPKTLDVKLMDFEDALLIEGRPVRKYADKTMADHIQKLLDPLVTESRHWFGFRTRLSKELMDVFQNLNDRGSQSQITLEAILDHDWFKSPSSRLN